MEYKITGKLNNQVVDIPDGTTYTSKEFKLKEAKVSGAVSLHLVTTGGTLAVNIESSNTGTDFCIPEGATSFNHAAGTGLYDLDIPISTEMRFTFTASGGDVQLDMGAVAIQ
jgi:hypothetical protein